MVCQLHIHLKYIIKKRYGRLLTLTLNVCEGSHFFLPITTSVIDGTLSQVLQTTQTQILAPMELTIWGDEHNK